ncbi:hypothetical protein GOP47_0021446 [Adiantum capillus-veneris]|uniref:3-ketoacyl-CoA synthase n=1 Tax=Adiantum capillus-veneris TaxID=13818 RepID=A0A9D4U7D4_ADICA|nr:hypothetical protein GOP47_0021446 [Adiantum capillus-veneris]
MVKEESLLDTEIVPNGSMSFSVRVRRRLPDFLQSVNLKYVKLGYHYLISHAIYLFTIPVLIAAFSAEVGTLSRHDLWQLWEHLEFNLVSLIVCSGVVVFVATLYIMSKPRPVYLVDFACFKPPQELQLTRRGFLQHAEETGKFNEQSMECMKRAMERSGLGEETSMSRSVLATPPSISMKEGRAEAELVMFSVLDELFEKTKVRPKDVSILVVNCSLFNPTPSLSAMIINHYKMRGNILSFNLGGMGCSAGVIALDLANDMLQAHGGSYAVVVSTENITMSWYMGNKESMLLPNCVFRLGGAAILLSNKSSEIRRAKYELKTIVRTHKGADVRSFKSIYQEEDENMQKGLSLSQDLAEVAGDALKTNITTMGPLVLPLSEQLLFLGALLCKRVFNKKEMKPYIPDFKLAFEHFCIHAAGRQVLDELQKNLELSDKHLEPSRMTLHRPGSFSSASSPGVVACFDILFYDLAFV